MKQYQHEQGAALVIVVMVLFVLGILSIPFISMGTQSHNDAVKAVQKQQAHYTALAGADAVAGTLMAAADPEILAGTMSGIGTGTFAGGSFQVQVQVVAEGIQIDATGFVPGISDVREHAGILLRKVTASDLYQYALYVTSPLDVSHLTYTEGEVVSNGAIRYPTPVFPTGLAYHGDITANAAVLITASGAYGTISPGNKTITLDTSSLADDALTLVVDDFVPAGGLVLKGDKPVRLFIGHSFSAQNASADLNNGDEGVKPFTVLLADGATFDIKSKTFYGYVYAPGGTVVLDSNTTVWGAMIAGTAIGSGGTNGPKADIHWQAIPGAGDSGSEGAVYEKVYR